ncbi:restriction endonuclease [Peribacillus asahii]|uniref:Restriction endonuclease n=1 Tax=Peribacillus asahii TaxID=228899 RepID=A0A3T0KNP8_9BACI|nr:hypothetical protein [Peribacillus asahii]AZV41999.1 restriction endonuclease [Peribacillus asahii]
MCAKKVNEDLIEDKKQEVLNSLNSIFSVTYVSGTNNQYQTKYVISKRFKSTYKKIHGKGAERNRDVNWKDDPRVWINIHTTYKKDGSEGLLIQIKCKCFEWLGGRSNNKKKFADKWGFPTNNKNIEYKVCHGKILNLWVMNKEILTFNPSQDYFSYFLEEAYKVYELNSLEYRIENLDDTTLLIAETNKDVHLQEEMEDYLYQKEVQESVGWGKRGEIVDVPVEKPLRSDKTTSETYKRNGQIGKIAIVYADFLCEVDDNHKDFTSNVTGRNYVEAHHLIPMEYQDSFDYSIDVEANIVSLCVSCHKKLHHAIFEEKEHILKQLYNNRKARLKRCRINITEEILLNYYK